MIPRQRSGMFKLFREGADYSAAGASDATSLCEVQRRGACAVFHDRPRPLHAVLRAYPSSDGGAHSHPVNQRLTITD
jgi:hypothetical protein